MKFDFINICSLIELSIEANYTDQETSDLYNSLSTKADMIPEKIAKMKKELGL